MSETDTEDYAPAFEHYETRWSGMQIMIRFDRDFLTMGRTHFQIESLPERTPMPISETGFLSHFTSPKAVEDAGGPVAYVLAALDKAGNSKEWKAREIASRQLTLF